MKQQAPPAELPPPPPPAALAYPEPEHYLELGRAILSVPIQCVYNTAVTFLVVKVHEFIGFQ